MGCLQHKDWRDLLTAAYRVKIARKVKLLMIGNIGDKYAYAFARQLEEDAYGKATCRDEYIHLLGTKLIYIKRELEKKHKGTEEE